jgi:DNA-directed RNA polymerase specialized sigma24 family protein
MFNDDFPLPADERASLATDLVDLRVDLGRAIRMLLQDGRISPFDVLATTLWLEGCGYREIADELQCSTGYAHKCVERVEDELRESGLMDGYE